MRVYILFFNQESPSGGWSLTVSALEELVWQQRAESETACKRKVVFPCHHISPKPPSRLFIKSRLGFELFLEMFDRIGLPVGLLKNQLTCQVNVQITDQIRQLAWQTTAPDRH